MLHVSIFIHCQNDLHTVASKSSYSNFNDLLYPILGIISLVWYLTFLFVHIWTKIFIYNCYWYELDRRSSSHYIDYFCMFLSLSHGRYRAGQKFHVKKINTAYISSYKHSLRAFCLRAINGKHVHIWAREHRGTVYFNYYKKNFSINLISGVFYSL